MHCLDLIFELSESRCHDFGQEGEVGEDVSDDEDHLKVNLESDDSEYELKEENVFPLVSDTDVPVIKCAPGQTDP